jgi:hypothetical protein
MSRCKWLMAVLLLVAQPVSAQYIGIFLDPEAASCAGDVGPTPRIDLHVVAVLEGAVTELAGAQFKIVGVPDTWTPENVLWVPDVGATISLGNPAFLSTIHPATPGVNIAFSTCQTGSGTHRVPLGRLVLLGPPTADNVHLQVTGFDLVPVDPDCPIAFRCDSPYFSKACVGGGEIVLNGPAPKSCILAVEERTWTNIKSLYRN